MNSGLKTVYRAVLNAGCKVGQEEGVYGTYKVEVYKPANNAITSLSFDWPPKMVFFEGELIEVVVIGEENG